ncbi:hypothetical protein [Amycolatopsis rubida]|uniref:Uncharacterized protein n=1 Tax=Amycolatopsis rubida TaxID=112413 RepID=A0A1I5MG24_9PSEU|nr:hypothetical protein [Amycolatopsis rubida]SFP08588.1 hypothetical protein SAMN05421854_10437 [Amycolatopsis rubida]
MTDTEDARPQAKKSWNRKPWECPSCGFRRAGKDEKPGPGVLARGAVHLTVGTVVDGWKVRPEKPGDVCRAWPSLDAYKNWLSFVRKEVSA